MKNTLLTVLRNKETSAKEFRKASEKLAYLLAGEIADHLKKDSISIETPIAPAIGTCIKDEIVLIPILRSGIALLTYFMQFFENAKVGFIGLQRDEETAIAEQYYYKVPTIKPNDNVVLLDPMVATGGSAIAALHILKKAGATEKKIFFAVIIAAQEGIDAIKKTFPKITICVAHVDKELNNNKYIVPGLGDFGDRYFVTEEVAKI